MKKYKTQQALKKIFNKPGFTYHEKIFEEIEDIVIGSGKESWFINVLAKNLAKLELLG